MTDSFLIIDGSNDELILLVNESVLISHRLAPYAFLHVFYYLFSTIIILLSLLVHVRGALIQSCFIYE